MIDSHITRRQAMGHLAGIGAACSLAPRLFANETSAATPRGKAEHCIFIWLGGGASHIDTWDPKRKADPKKKESGSYYDAIDTAIPGVQVCQHLSHCAPLLDRFCLLRTVNHNVIDEHARATNQVHTGRPTSETIVYPSIGSIVAHERGSAGDRVPAYMVLGLPAASRGPGFLGAKYGYLYLTDTRKGPPGFARATDVDDLRQQRRDELLAMLRHGYLDKHEADRQLAEYHAAAQEARRLSGPEFMKLFRLQDEPDDVREAFGDEFGQRLLLSRRLVQAGVRFIEVSHNVNFVNGTGWDTHNEGQLKQHLLIEQLDAGLAALVVDLERQKLLDKTLIVVATEFGRPAWFDGGGGRGHYSKAFSVVLAGGGLRTGQAIGQTDELGMKILERPISLPDLHATIHAALGIDPGEHLYADARPVPITDQGTPLGELF